MDCKICKETKGISQYEKDIQSAEHRHSMSILWRIILGQTIIICLLVGGIFYTVNSYDLEVTGTTTQNVTVDGKDGTANYNVIGESGSIVNGESSGNDNENVDGQSEAQGRTDPGNG
jgi:hypothetical protein